MQTTRILFLCLLILGVCSFAACNSEVEGSGDATLVENTQSVRVNLRATLTPFDASQASAARAAALTWREGDVIYLQYTAYDGTTDNGTLTYRSGAWNLSYSKRLIRNVATKCCACYLDGAGAVGGVNVSLLPTTGIYTDNDASYSYPEGGNVTITCNLVPQTSRIRFKGAAGTKFSLSGLSYGGAYNLSSGNILPTSSAISLTIQEDGFSPYVYGHFTSSTEPYMFVTSDKSLFTLNCKGYNILNIGESGWMQLPTADEHYGWEMTTNDYVDLGLPSGTLWAICNVGAESSDDYGSYFAWGEVEPKNKYSWSNYKYCGGSSITLTKYCLGSSYGVVDSKNLLDSADDAATANWGENWCTPTEEQWAELMDQCTWTWAKQNGKNGYIVASKSNDQSIFLPASGSYQDNSLYNDGYDGYYWSRTLSYDSSSDACCFGFPSRARDILHFYRCSGLSVRPVFAASQE